MKTLKEILKDVETTFTSRWTDRAGTVVPDVDDVQLGNDGVRLDATIVYADMTDSTGLVDGYKDWFAAEIYKSYLLSACHVLRNNSGVITSFDGDRVMAVFIGVNKNSQAAKSGLQINAVARGINATLKQKYPSTGFSLRQTIGIDTSKILVARTGIRNSNDLVWVGAAANHAAKLCGEADGSKTVVISKKVYEKLNDASKLGGSPSRDMWEKSLSSKQQEIYRSSWYWDF